MSKQGLLEFTEDDFIRYQNVFFSLNPENGRLSAHKTRSAFIQSKLPIHDLTKIWKLVKENNDEGMNLVEFSTCLRLIQAAVCGLAIPIKLPQSLTNHKQCTEVNIPIINNERARAYELIFYWLQPDVDGNIKARKVLNFLACSNLSDDVLSRVWSYSGVGDDGVFSYEAFLILLHLTIYCKTSHTTLTKAVLDAYNLLPPKLRKESLNNKENRLIELQLEMKSTQVQKNKHISKEEQKALTESLIQLKRKEQLLKDEIRNSDHKLRERPALKELFNHTSIRSGTTSWRSCIDRMKNEYNEPERLNESEKIFVGDNIVNYSKTLVVTKRLEPRRKSKSDVQRRLTSELLSLTEDIEKFRKETSSDFKELNKEFEQVKATVGQGEVFPSLFDLDKERVKLPKKVEKRKRAEENLILKKHLKVEESELDFYSLFTKLEENEESSEGRASKINSLRSWNFPKERTQRSRLAPTEPESNSRCIEKSTKRNNHRSNFSDQKYKSSSLPRTSPLKYPSNDPKGGSLKRKDFKRNSLRKRKRSDSPENTLASDFANIFKQLSFASDTSPETEDREVKDIVEDVLHHNLKNESFSLAKNKEVYLGSLSDSKNVVIAPQSLPTVINKKTTLIKDNQFVDLPVKENNTTKSFNRTNKNISLQEALAKRKQEYLRSLEAEKDACEEKKENYLITQTERKDSLKKDTSKTGETAVEDTTEDGNLSQLDTKSVFASSKNIFEHQTYTKETPQRLLIKDQSLFKSLLRDHLPHQQTLNHTVDDIQLSSSATLTKRKEDFDKAKSGVGPEVRFKDISVDNSPLKGETTWDVNNNNNNNINKHNKDNNREKTGQFVDHSVNKILRNISFNNKESRSVESNTKSEKEDVKTILKKISNESENNKRDKRKVRHILSQLSFNSARNMATLEELLEMQNNPDLTEQEKKRVAFDIRRRQRQHSEKAEGKVVVLDKATLDKLKQAHLGDELPSNRNMNLFYTGKEAGQSDDAVDLDSMIANENNSGKTLETLSNQRYNAMNKIYDGSQVEHSNRPLTHGNYFETDDMFFHESESEQARQTFIRSKSDASGLESSKGKRVIRTRSGRIIKKGPGLINRNDPEQVSFQQESEWLEKLVGDAVEINKLRGYEDLEARKSTDFIAFGSPMLPTDDPESLRRVAEANEEEERERLRTKSMDVLEENIEIHSRKTWLESLVQSEDDSTVSATPRSQPSTQRDVNIANEISVPPPKTENLDKADGTKKPQTVYHKSDPFQFLEPIYTTQKEVKHEVKKEQQRPKEIISEQTPTQEVFSPTEDDESRGNAYMLPSALRKQKKESVNHAPKQVDADSQHIQSVKQQRSIFEKSNPASNNFKNTNQTNGFVRSNSQASSLSSSRGGSSDCQLTTSTTSLSSTGEITVPVHKQEQATEEEQLKIPSVKEKMRIFMNQSGSKTDDVVLRKKPSEKSSPRPKSYGGANLKQYTFGKDYDDTDNAPKSKQSNGVIIGGGKQKHVTTDVNSATKRHHIDTDRNNNYDVSSDVKRIDIVGKEYKHCVRDQRILKEIEEMEQRENEIRNRRNTANHTERESSNKQTNNVSPNSNTHSVIPRNEAEGLQAFLQENEVKN
ncbi:uncharacterized protein LOC130629830 isoform X2 [Hydractinia symbiolongicarpus]|uniref:uncharacterized protein LOC130629830 isoform X2 n=1 Tax=Hydractinia symbiolongicarpus TaxID=13093 RepID=UPI00254A42B0|nr:uncharacterized protein LOC130629830 isoform X2 [Hydractinia symbiolongicarpus]